ncbi:MAG: thiamine pyrophosphate-dependent dehydrogenase E1 component subunit alpha [Firmicutes bacterium]|nr:thiamine pyrophosphate-dependent dehydrogenase E1 component subunit alpha [Bacillota bacterium]
MEGTFTHREEDHARQFLQWYELMLTIRRFEEQTIEWYQRGLIGGSLHPAIGQEAIAVGALDAVRPTDYMTMTYRGRGQALAKGASLEGVMAEVLGKASGLCKGKGGPMHITDVTHGIIGANAIVAAGIPIAVGAALAAHLAGDGRIAVTFFGDGAVNQGVFHEALNLAAIWTLPIVFVCENNLYSEMTPIREMVKNEAVSERAAAYRIPAAVVDGNDVAAVAETVGMAIDRARSGGGPTFIEALTYRFVGHMVGDPETYRSREEVAQWREKDPILQARRRIEAEGWATPESLTALDDRVTARIRTAAEQVLQAPEPDLEERLADVY